MIAHRSPFAHLAGRLSAAKAAAAQTAKKAHTPSSPAKSRVSAVSFAHLRKASEDVRAQMRSLAGAREADAPANAEPNGSAQQFAIAMERAQAQAAGRAPRKLLDLGPKQTVVAAIDDNEMIDFLQRRNADRAAPRHNRVGR